MYFLATREGQRSTLNEHRLNLQEFMQQPIGKCRINFFAGDLSCSITSDFRYPSFSINPYGTLAENLQNMILSEDVTVVCKRWGNWWQGQNFATLCSSWCVKQYYDNGEHFATKQIQNELRCARTLRNILLLLAKVQYYNIIIFLSTYECFKLKTSSRLPQQKMHSGKISIS